MAKNCSLNVNNQPQTGLNDLSAKEKIQITRIVKPTLEKLNSISNQMKKWRIERAKLNDNVCRLKLALNKQAEDGSQTQPSMNQLKEQMRQLEMTKGTLEEEIKHLKSALIEAQVDVKRTNNGKLKNQMLRMKDSFTTEKRLWSREITYLRKRLKEVEDTFQNSMTNREKNMRIVFKNVISEVVGIVTDLLEELSELGNHLDRSKIENENLRTELDNLKAMVGTKSADNSHEYFENLGRVNVLMDGLKLQLQDMKKTENISVNVVKSLQSIEKTQDLLKALDSTSNGNSLLILHDDYNRFELIKKLIDLRTDVQLLNLELKNSIVKNEFDPTRIGKSLQLLDVDICELRDRNPKNDDWITIGLNADGYSRKIETLVNIIQGSRETIEKLQAESITRYDKAKLENVESYIGKLCREVETFVEGISISTKNDEVSLVERIRKLEGTILQSELESTTEENSANYLHSELKSPKPLTNEVKVLRSKISQLTKEVSSAKGEAKEKGIQALALLREHENLKNRFDNTEKEFNQTTVKIQTQEKEKKSLRIELSKLREILREKDKSKKSLDKEIIDLKDQLHHTIVDNDHLRKRIRELKQRYDTLKIKNNNEENGFPEVSSSTNLQEAEETVQHLKNQVNDLTNNVSKLRTEACEISSIKEILEDRLNVQSSKAEEFQKLSQKQQNQLISLRNDNEALKNKYAEATCRTLEIESNFNSKSMELDKKLQRTQNEKETLRAEFAELKYSLEAAEIAQDHWKNDNTRLSENFHNLSVQTNKLNDQLKTFELMNVRLKKELGDMRIENENQNDTLSMKNEELTLAIREVEEKREQLMIVQREYEGLKKILGIPPNWNLSDLEFINPRVSTGHRTDAQYANVIIKSGITEPIENSTGQTKAQLSKELPRQNGALICESIQFKNEKPKMNLRSNGTKDMIEFTKQNNPCNQGSTNPIPVINFPKEGIIDCIIKIPNTSEKLTYHWKTMSSHQDHETNDYEDVKTTGNNNQSMEYKKEMRALKMEVLKLREEKMDLLLRLRSTRMESEASNTERIALKNELLGLREKKSNLSLEVDNLKSDNERLKQINSGIEDKLTGVLKGVNKYTTGNNKSNNIESKLELILKDYTTIRKIT